MSTKPVKFVVPKIPELDEDLTRYGVSLEDEPPYALVGVLRSPSVGRIIGILAFAGNEFHAYLLRQKLNKIGICNIEKTEYHPDPGNSNVFSISKYMKRLVARRKH